MLTPEHGERSGNADAVAVRADGIKGEALISCPAEGERLNHDILPVHEDDAIVSLHVGEVIVHTDRRTRHELEIALPGEALAPLCVRRRSPVVTVSGPKEGGLANRCLGEQGDREGG